MLSLLPDCDCDLLWLRDFDCEAEAEREVDLLVLWDLDWLLESSIE